MSPQALSDRHSAILLEVIRLVLSSHQPVSGRTLAKVSDQGLSATSIRNIMEDLVDEGYLLSLGGGKGRVPSQAGLYYYVAALGQEMAREDQRPISRVWPGLEAQAPLGLEGLLDAVGAQLARLTGWAVLAALPPKDTYPFNWLRLSPVEGQRVMMTLETLFGDLWCKVVEVGNPMPLEVLLEVERFLCSQYRGETLEQVRGHIMGGAGRSLLVQAPSMGGAFRLLRHAFAWADRPAMRHWGEANLFGAQALQQPATLLCLHHALQDPMFLPQALAAAKPLPHQGQVAIGTDLACAGLENCAMLSMGFGPGTGWQGLLAVLGPRELDYGQVYQLLSEATRLLGRRMRELLSQNPISTPLLEERS